MGYEKSKRPLLAPGIAIVDGAASTGPATVSGDVDLAGDVRVGGNFSPAGAIALQTEALTGSTALQTLSTKTVSFITQGTSGAGRDFRLPAPRAGLLKTIHVSANTTSPNNTVIQCNSTAHTFFGSTFNSATIADSTVRSRYFSLMLVGVSTSQWAVLSGSTTFWTFSATTGSTGQ